MNKYLETGGKGHDETIFHNRLFNLLSHQMDMGRGNRALPNSERGVSAPVGVVDHGIEGLVDPLPEHHRRRGPETEQVSHHPIPCGLAVCGMENLSPSDGRTLG